MLKEYSWERYWFKDGESPHLIDGFLYIFEKLQSEYTLDSKANIKCLVLLGEPGTGKSTEIKRISKNQRVEVNDKKLYFDLSDYNDGTELKREIFESDEIKNWKENDGNLYLFLDSLDEALVDINTLALSLATKIGELPTERLFLRISCRTAEWSNLSVLEDKLKELWKNKENQIIQIAPLQRKDVEIAAQTEGLDSELFDSEVFLSEVYEKNVTVLASKPITLNFLLQLFAKDGSFPSTQTKLYEDGCLNLCVESNKRRVTSKRVSKLSPRKKLRIAARIAMLMIFANKSSIWIGGTTDGEEQSDILIDELTGIVGKENVFEANSDDILDVISNTGLFIRNGNNRLKFYHQTFAEFLSSWYLQYIELSNESVIKLIGDKYLYPQLYETSAWIANQNQFVFEHLMSIAPKVLLRSDILLAEDSAKEKLVEILLDLFDNEESEGIDRTYYRKLKHPKLAEQIRPYLVDKNKGWLVRSEALDMAQMCEIKELQNDFAKIALCKNDDYEIRIHSAYALALLGDSEIKAKLKPLIWGNEDDDPKFRLKGVALDTLWDEHLTAKELFSVLTASPNYSFTGSYEVFLSSEMLDKLKVEDVPIALDWLAKNITSFGHSDFSERRLADRILIMAWENLDKPDIFQQFVEIATKILSNHDDIFKEIKDEEILESILKDEYNRRRLWLSIYLNTDEKNYWLDRSKFIGLYIEDIEWLAQTWNTVEDKSIKSKLLVRLKEFVGGIYSNPNIVDNYKIHLRILNEIFKACENNKGLKEELKEFFIPIELESEEAKKLKAGYEKNFSWEKRQLEAKEKWKKPISPSPKERVLEWLENFESGDISGFWQVNWWLMFHPNGRTDVSEHQIDLTKFPVWQEINEDIKSRIIEAAQKYLLEGNPKNEKWIKEKTIYRPAFAGYRAIKLLEKFTPDVIDELPNAIWVKWSATIYHYPIFSNNEDHYRFIARLYEKIPKSFVKLFTNELDNKTTGHDWSFDKLEYCWDEKLKNILKKRIEVEKTNTSKLRKTLSLLFRLEDSEVEQIACDFITLPTPTNKTRRENLMLCVRLLIAHGKIDCWEKIWQILKYDIEFGKELVEYGGCGFGTTITEKLSEEQTAQLFIWLSIQYPHKEDPVHRGVYTPGVRDEIVRWRNSLLAILKEKGTKESVSEIKRIKEELPHLNWIKFTLLEAKEKMRANSWNSLEPDELDRFIIIDSKQKSLEKLDAELQVEREMIEIVNSIAKTKGGRKANYLLIFMGVLFLSIMSFLVYSGFTYSNFFISALLLIIPIIVSNLLGKEWKFTKASEQLIESEKQKLLQERSFDMNEHNLKLQRRLEIRNEIRSLNE